MLASRFAALFGRRRGAAQLAADALSWAIGVCFAVFGRYDFQARPVNPSGLAFAVAVAVFAQTACGYALGLYNGRWRYGSFEEIVAVVRAVAVTTALLVAVDLAAPGVRPIPLSTTGAGGVAALVVMSAVRYAWRLQIDRLRRPTGEEATRVVVFGAGDAGWQLISSMMGNRESAYYPVALIDDDQTKGKLRLMGVPVVGGRDAIPRAAADYDATVLIVALPSADAALINELTAFADQAKLAVKVLPPLSEMFDDHVDVSHVRDVSEADLLGRHQIEVDLDAMAGYINGRRVLVTGAGGSIGSELCRQVHRLGASELIMLDRDESALHGVQLAVHGHGLLDSSDLVLADIRDIEAMNRILATRRPDVVFHAAALKHLPLLESHPGEAVKSNVWGTLTVLQAAAANGVERFVNISTDKAADPTSVLGYSKRIAERLTAHFAYETDWCYVSVRFGNVLGSRGSVLTTFQAQVDAGGPLTVTHPDVTRYFMTVQEAVQLVVQAGAGGQPGDVLVLDMGQPVRIADVAARLASQAKRPLKIVFTGLRAGEKLHEQLLAQGEPDHRPAHPLVSHARVEPLWPTDALSLDAWAPSAEVRQQLRALCAHSSIIRAS
ncbi:MAG: polysaccharide biosynthesis protein [Frankia sp.]|nr:polysaccharide biosynthesis protein [Frankia sp.]MCA1833598.1 polysaccharide biosynthesis protein [Actinomycetota bacterium]